ncbi:RNA polymerase sigma-70 factor [Mangrovibacterium lignilyticum]|uniref:RNA polymerase sigma-70 factor n=1 Tax=Mangrovibacterium lignilyticum TaxID=2668052 RepID=UPI0013CF6A33|nr:RNA polymerase sigma-70 factor [Mangrovibacterium lignilyticum]
MDEIGKNIFEKFVVRKDQDSFAQLFEHYFNRLFQFAMTIVKSELLAEEIVLDVFMKLWGKREDLARITNIKAYMYIAVRNSAITAIRAKKKVVFEIFDSASVSLSDYQLSAENELIEEEMFQDFNEAVKSLPEKCKIIFKLIREDGLNRNEVADILGISVKTVDNQIAIAVRKIADRLNIDLCSPAKSISLLALLFSAN